MNMPLIPCLSAFLKIETEVVHKNKYQARFSINNIKWTYCHMCVSKGRMNYILCNAAFIWRGGCN